MRLEDYFVTVAPNDVRIKVTRVGIETVLYDFIHRGDAPETIAARYPSECWTRKSSSGARPVTPSW